MARTGEENILSDDLEDALGDGDYLEADDDSLEDDDEVGIDYHSIDHDVQAREARKHRFTTGMTGGQELSSALRLGGTRLRDASGAGVRENPSDVKTLRAGEVSRIEVYFRNGRKLIITE